VLRWLTRLFRQREAVETASPAAPPSSAPPLAALEPTASDATGNGQPATVAVTTATEPEKETCPTCGRTSVFAGPPGQRFCTYCALRDELFEARAAASE
jgi:hypothetical protein